MNDTIGIDVSKATLDAFRRSTGDHRRFPNVANGCKGLIRWIGPGHSETTRIEFEPTGPYHRVQELARLAAGLHLVKVNPRSARRLAEATGVLAKTDRIDACFLAGIGALHHALRASRRVAALKPASEENLRPPERSRKTRLSRPDSRHAKASHLRQLAPAG